MSIFCSSNLHLVYYRVPSNNNAEALLDKGSISDYYFLLFFLFFPPLTLGVSPWQPRVYHRARILSPFFHPLSTLHLTHSLTSIQLAFYRTLSYHRAFLLDAFVFSSIFEKTDRIEWQHFISLSLVRVFALSVSDSSAYLTFCSSFSSSNALMSSGPRTAYSILRRFTKTLSSVRTLPHGPAAALVAMP